MAAAVARWALVSAPPVAAALWTFKHLNTELAPFADPLMATCKAETEPIDNPVLKIFHFFNCFLVPFFKALVATPEGSFVWLNFVAVAGSWGALMYTETSRLGTRILLSPPLLVVHTIIFTVLGLSIGMPLVYLPVYFAVGLPSSFPSSASLQISWARVWALWVTSAVFFAVSAATLAPWGDESHLELAIMVLVWAPIFVPLLWMLVPVSTASDAEKGQKASVHMHAFFAGLAFTCHVASALYLATQPSIVDKLLALFASHEGPAAVTYFILIDFTIFWGAAVYQVLVEGGLVPALVVVLTTPVLGFGAPLSFFYMHRESLLFTHHKSTAPAGGGSRRSKRKEA